MAVTVKQTPGQYNLAYGSNAIVLDGMTTETKYVIRVKDQQGNILADVRQAPNQFGEAIFDLQNILQTYVGPGRPFGDNNINYANSFFSGFSYDIDYGTETGSTVTIDGTVNNLEVYPGRKLYYENFWDAPKYMSTVASNPLRVTNEGAGLTDNKTLKTETLTGLTGLQTTLTSQFYDNTIRIDDALTISYLQIVIPDDSGVGDQQKSIAAFKVLTYDANNNLLNGYQFENTLSNGGGPNAFFGDNAIPAFPYSIISFGAGPFNLSSLGVDFNNVAKYYVMPYSYDLETTNTPIPTNIGSDNLLDEPGWYGHKFTIDNGICLDYEPIQFSWMNSFGFRDYFSFTKRNERRVRIKRNTYLKNPVNYNGADFNIQPEQKGSTVYSQELNQQFTANTDYVSDEDAAWLESLFVSPDVRVRFHGSTDWLPVVLDSSSYTQRTFQKDRLFQYEVRFSLAHNIKSQRG